MMNRSKFLTVLFAASVAITPCVQASIANTAVKMVMKQPGLACGAALGVFGYWNAGKLKDQIQADIKAAKNFTLSLKGALTLAALAAVGGYAAHAGVLAKIPVGAFMKFASKHKGYIAAAGAAVYEIRALFGPGKKDDKK